MVALLELSGTATQTAVATVASRIPPQLRAHCFQPGVSGNPKGRPLGAKSQTILYRTETKLARKYVQKALSDGDKEQGAMLRHAMDKFVPDAGMNLSDVLSRQTTVIVIAESAQPRELSVPADETIALPASENPPALPAPLMNAERL